ncbi:MAG: transcriptional regulator, TetR family [Bryobacterales bacterium]|nr:transcriptional regulator, TetR family [Bryobacterales bacterium]
MAFTKQKSATVSNRGRDKRVERTRLQLDAAFVELLHRRSYDSIRVSDIAKKAGVGRATYYAHYSSKHDLLRSQFGRIVAPMLVLTREGTCPVDGTHLFAHVQTAPRLYKALMGGRETSGGARVLRECFDQRIEQLLRRAGGLAKFPIPTPMITRFVASSLLAVIEWWVENGARESPRELQAIFRQLAWEGLARPLDLPSAVPP